MGFLERFTSRPDVAKCHIMTCITTNSPKSAHFPENVYSGLSATHLPTFRACQEVALILLKAAVAYPGGVALIMVCST